MSELQCCPFCGTKLELVREHYWCHPTDEKCILRHLCFEADDLEGVELWNTRRPMELIVDRLEKELYLADKEKERSAKENPLQFDSAKGYANGVAVAIEIVKEEGGL